MDLSITVNGIKFPNPFLLGSGPPGTNARVIAKSFDAGWGGAVAKTVSLESAKVVNVVPRYGRLRSRDTGEVIGFENIELISDRPIEVWLDEFRTLKKEYPHNVLVASIMEEYDKARWQELTRLVQETGVDAFELNFSCPHGMTERRMGSEMGEHPGLDRGGHELGHGSGEDSRLGEDDAQHHQHQGAVARRRARRRGVHLRHQHDPLGHRR